MINESIFENWYRYQRKKGMRFKDKEEAQRIFIILLEGYSRVRTLKMDALIKESLGKK